MKKYIVVAFTLQGQSIEQIAPILQKISEQNPDATLVHGFLPREVVEEKQFSPAVVDALDKYFPEQKSFYSLEQNTPDRTAMKNFAYNNQAKVFVIGKIVAGVLEEVLLYLKAGIETVFIPLEEDGYSMGPSQSAPAAPDSTEGTLVYNESALLSFGSWLLTNDADYKERGPSQPLTTDDVEAWERSKTDLLTSNNETMQKDLSDGPVNSSNPNALENHPAGNGNATPVTNTSQSEQQDSNGAAGDPLVQSKQEPSLASSPEAVGNSANGATNEGNDIHVGEGSQDAVAGEGQGVNDSANTENGTTLDSGAAAGNTGTAGDGPSSEIVGE